MSFMTPPPLGYDSFTRANQAGWGTATDGQAWSQVAGTLVLSIAANEGHVAGGAGASVNFLGSKTFLDGHGLCRMKFSITSASISIILRATATNTFYFARYGNAIGQIDISKDVAGTITQLVTGAFAPAINTPFWCRFQVSGKNLNAKWWLDGSAEPGGWTLTTTDTIIATPGQLGMRVATTAGNTIDIDMYSVRSLDTIGSRPKRQLARMF